MNKTQLTVGIIWVLITPVSYATSLEAVSVVDNKQSSIMQNLMGQPINLDDTSAIIVESVLTSSPRRIETLRTNMQWKAHVFAAQKPKRVKLRCKGSKSNEWKIRINLKTKRMRVNLKNLSAFNIPITYFRWNDDDHKRMKVIAGKGKKRVSTTLDGSKSCRLNFSKRRYAYSISAKIARTTHLSGCCSDISH
jgi:hypothetical protein